jgi:hypothetical protein
MGKSKRGRAPKGEIVGKSSVMNFRITPSTKAALERAAKESGRSVSQETEHRLRRDLFEHGSEETYAVLRVAAYAIDRLTTTRGPSIKWIDDPYLFEQAKRAIVTTLDLLGPREPLAAPATDKGPRRQGEIAAHETLRDILIADQNTPRARQTKDERALLILKGDIEKLIDRARPYGQSAAQLQDEKTVIEKRRADIERARRQTKKGSKS